MRISLTEKELTKSYARFFEMPYPDIPSDLLEKMSEPMDPSKSMKFENLNDFFDATDAELFEQVGWCVKDDGSGYVGSLTKMPGVTLDMFKWWFTWHGIESLRYKIWDPNDHYSACVTAEHLKQRLDISLPLEDRFWDTSDFVVENVGDGTVTLRIAFRRPEAFGFDMERFNASPVTAVCAHSGPPQNDVPRAAFVHFAREVEGGIEVHTRFWMGYMVLDKMAVRSEAQISPVRARGLAHHCPSEYHRLGAFLPQIYAENAHIVQKPEDFKVINFTP